MLELGQVVAQIGDMGAEVKQRTQRLTDQMATALQKADVSVDEWAATRARIDAMGPPQWQQWATIDLPPSTTYALPYPAPLTYTALATDGSQIPLDRHAMAPCYLLNVGMIALHYGTGERPLLESRATLHYKPEEIYSTSQSGEETPVSERWVATKRLLAESAALAELIAINHQRDATALVDDPLIVWTPTGESDEMQKRIIDEFCEMLNAGMNVRVPIAGYVSRPGHRDVVGTLRMTLCREGCTHGPNAPCRAIAHLSDAQLFSRLLSGPGDRSQAFGSHALNLKHYPPEHQICFFYLHVGAEVARVEIPQWVTVDKELLDKVHVAVYDQVVKGQGYPIALSEAHERAIVRGPERDAFFRLVEQSFIRQNLPIMTTRKSMSKRRPLV